MILVFSPAVREGMCWKEIQQHCFHICMGVGEGVSLIDVLLVHVVHKCLELDRVFSFPTYILQFVDVFIV